MRVYKEVDVDVDVDDILDGCGILEKKELLRSLLDDDEIASKEEKMEKKRSDEQALMRTLERMSFYELKKLLCNLLGVYNYNDEQALRDALEPIIKQR